MAKGQKDTHFPKELTCHMQTCRLQFYSIHVM